MSDYAPMKAVLSERLFSDPHWLFERTLGRTRDGRLWQPRVHGQCDDQPAREVARETPR